MRRYAGFVISLIALLAAACGTVATPEWAAEAQGTRAALVSTDQYLTAIAPTATPTPAPTSTSTPTLPPTATALPSTATSTPAPATATPVPPTAAAQVAAADVAAGDPVKGDELFHTTWSQVNFACSTCHYVDKEDQLIGPGLLNIADRAASRVPGETAYEYLHQSIVNPSAYVVPNYPDGLMPQTFAQFLSEEQISDIIAYLYTLKS